VGTCAYPLKLWNVKSLRSIIDKGSALPLNNDYFKMKDNIVNSTLIFQCKRYIAQLVYDTAALEDSPYTFPEVQTLLDGVTVGGHRLSDQKLITNQRDSWNLLFKLIEKKEFVLTKDIACRLQGEVAEQEALEWGCFRTGSVRISGTNYKPPKSDDLESQWIEMEGFLSGIEDTRSRAMVLFLSIARNQFFWDGNKRTGRLMMNGVLLANGISPILIPAKEKLAFNTKMVKFYDSGDTAEMLEFLRQFHVDFDS